MTTTDNSQGSLTPLSSQSQPSTKTDDLWINPCDGWHAELVENAPKLELVVQVMGGGESFACVTVADFDMEEERAQADLYLTLMIAVCRFMNAGGDITEVACMLDCMRGMFRDYSIQFPEGWELIAVLQDVQEPTYVVGHRESGRCLVVVEDERSEIMDIEDLSELIR